MFEVSRVRASFVAAAALRHRWLAGKKKEGRCALALALVGPTISPILCIGAAMGCCHVKQQRVKLTNDDFQTEKSRQGWLSIEEDIHSKF